MSPASSSTQGERPPPRVLAVTGGFGSGKSTAVKILAELGAAIVSADDLARRVVLAPSDTLHRIVAEFGDSILSEDGSLNRKKLGKRVFADPDARRSLESIMHPAIRAAFREDVRRLSAQNSKQIIVYEAPVLFEAGPPPEEVEAILLIAAPEERCVERAMARDRLSREEALQRIAAQLSMEEKRRRADYVIENDSDIESLRANVVEFYRKFQGGTNDGCVV